MTTTMTTLYLTKIGRGWHLIEQLGDGYRTICQTGGWEVASSFDALWRSLALHPTRGTPYRTRKAATDAAERLVGAADLIRRQLVAPVARHIVAPYHALGSWYLAPAGDLADEWSAGGYYRNVFATREEAESRIPGLVDCGAEFAAVKWVAVQRTGKRAEEV